MRCRPPTAAPAPHRPRPRRPGTPQNCGAADPASAGAQRDLGMCFNDVGDVQFRLGETRAALQSYRDGLAITQKLAAADPDSAEVQRDLSVSFNNVGDVEVRL